ncbi:MAG: hypothetical protein ACOY0T_20605 [Myxococcota bacterium]
MKSSFLRTAPASALPLLVAAALSSCSKARKQPETSAHPEPAGALLSGASAFDLVATPSGAFLVWAPEERSFGGVLAQEFDTNAHARGSARALLARSDVGGQVLELAAIRGAQRTALAFFEKNWAGAKLVAAEGDANASLQRIEIGVDGSGVHEGRGNLALVLESKPDAFSLWSRAGEAECVETGRRDCTAFSWWRLSDARAEARGLPLSVPTPCREHALTLLREHKGLHYAVCSQASSGSAARENTLFTIQNSPEYARADKLLAGCHALGLFTAADTTWLVGECNGQRRAARVGSDNGAIEVRELSSPRLECVNGRARLRAGPIDTLLEEPRAQLAPVLPSTLAPRDSRAAWTGQALLVVSSRARRLDVTRYACQGSSLRQLETPKPAASR